MKKISTIFFLALFCCPFAFDKEADAVSRALPSSKSVTEAETSRNVSERAVVARTGNVQTSSSSNDTSTQNTVVRSGSRVISVGSNSGVASRSNAVPRAGASTANQPSLSEVVNTVGRNARVEEASINNNPVLRRAGITLRPSTAEVGGRATIAGTDIQTGSNIGQEVRALASRAATDDQPQVTTRETIEQAKERLEQAADLNKSCQEQYNDCMDQFCAVIDANQKRCSCSANLSKYSKVEEAVKEANRQLNEVAQRIRYVGLSADEISAIMSETEAEAALSGKEDVSETRNMLEEIEKMIQDPVSTSSSSSSNTLISGLDMNLDFSMSTDIFNLDFLNTNTTSFSNLRGKDLYNAAKNRCNTILTQCKDAGATPQQITGNYDLAIDKDCIAYEQGLEKMNETLVSNVRSANLMLQKARLAVLQNKNMYDAKGCISALDACMTDEMVCGEDYTKCLDPTKIFIDENGEVVLGQNITKITDFMKEYNNADISKSFLEQAYGQAISSAQCAEDKADDKDGGNDGSCVVKYLLTKIGVGETPKEGGLCRPVLDKCQMYTYDDAGEYQPYNDVVVNYVQRAMVNIKAAQQKIISDYSSSCMLDIANCYNQQVTQVNAWSTSANVDSIYNVMRGACRNVALTCAYAVFADEVCDDTDESQTNNCHCPEDGAEKCINSISEMFYQSLLCPDNSTYQAAGCVEDETGAVTIKRCVNNRCQCNDTYEAVGTQCLKQCPANSTRSAYGVCVCNEDYVMSNNVCIKKSE